MARQMVKADQSVYVSEFYGDHNFFRLAKEAVFIGRFQGRGDSYRSLLHFDHTIFSSNQALVQQGHPVYLRLTIARNEVSSGAVQCGIHRILSPWDPQSVTWNTQPGKSRHPDVIFLIPTQWVGMILIDINVLVNMWIKRVFPNYGLMITGDEGTDSLVSFRTDVWAGSRSVPVLLLSTRSN